MMPCLLCFQISPSNCCLIQLWHLMCLMLDWGSAVPFNPLFYNTYWNLSKTSQRCPSPAEHKRTLVEQKQLQLLWTLPETPVLRTSTSWHLSSTFLNLGRAVGGVTCKTKVRNPTKKAIIYFWYFIAMFSTVACVRDNGRHCSQSRITQQEHKALSPASPASRQHKSLSLAPSC